MEQNKCKARVLAFYLPQFHPIPENDEWWMKGFTEWTNVGKARRLFPGHYQPKVPADLGYYDLRLSETRKAQADMAREFGIEGFCYWHYWFGNGRRLLERPFNEVLRTGKPDFPFCLAWANESWRGFYHGIKSKEALIDQLYPGEDDYIAHFMEVLPAFKDKRYITIDGKPLFLIYHPLQHPEMSRFISLWQELAIQNGLNGVFFVGQTFYVDDEKDQMLNMGFDALNAVRLFDYEKKARLLFECAKWRHKILRHPRIVDYKAICPYLVGDAEYNVDVFPTAFPNWDHTPRSGNKGLVLNHSEPRYFRDHMSDVVEHVKDKPYEHRIIFVKSWNEWAEGNYLEPDLRFGKGFLEVIKECLTKM